MRATWMISVLGIVVFGGCSGDDTDALQQERDRLSAEVEALRSQQDLLLAKHEKSAATMEAAEAILADPEAFGTETQIAEAIAQLATADAQIEDDVFGSINYRDGYYDTLFAGDTDAVIDVYDRWLSEDGSQGGSLWIWRGTNVMGNPFELIGISLFDFDDEGRIAHELVTYPYTDDYVIEAFEGAGTVPMATATQVPSAPERPFSFATDDLCTWLTTDELTAALGASFDWEGEVVDPTPTAGGCTWSITGGDEDGILEMSPADHGDDATIAWSDASELDPVSAFGQVITGHPWLPEGTAYVPGGFGYLAFGTPGTDQWFQIGLYVPGTADVPAYWEDDSLFAFASRVMSDLAWVEATAG